MSSSERRTWGLGTPGTLTCLSWSLVLLLCVSMALVSRQVAPVYHINFDSRNLMPAALSVVAFGFCVRLVFFSNNPFGVAVSAYLFTITAGYLWLSFFTPLQYDHTIARLSAAASWMAFATPALLINARLRIRDWLTSEQMDRLVLALIGAAALIAVRGYFLGFYFIGFADGDQALPTIVHPAWMRYAIPAMTTAILPFCYAWLIMRGRYALAVLTLVVCLSFNPITLNKTTLLTPAWLAFVTVLLRLTQWRIAVALSLLIPIAVGLIALALDQIYYTRIFFRVNFRMFAIPSSALDHYFHYFSTHPLTNFCQISIIGKLFNCSLPELGVLLNQEYRTGNYNASLLATEGIASVGAYLAPISALLCGMVIAAANLACSRLAPAFVILSSAAMLPIIMNVPLSMIALTHGGFLLVALWLLTPSEGIPKISAR